MSLVAFRRARAQVKRYNVMGVRFDVDAQYSLLDVVGQGAYGVVCAALDEDSGETVAIKKITNAFEHELYAKRTLREIRLLRLLKHDNLIGLKIILPPLKSDGVFSTARPAACKHCAHHVQPRALAGSATTASRTLATAATSAWPRSARSSLAPAARQPR